MTTRKHKLYISIKSYSTMYLHNWRILKVFGSNEKIYQQIQSL